MSTREPEPYESVTLAAGRTLSSFANVAKMRRAIRQATCNAGEIDAFGRAQPQRASVRSQ